MKYSVRINKSVRNVHVYRVLKKTSGNVNVLTKLFISVFSRGKKEEKPQV